jgi:type II secretory pathway pseudopilin PulG
MSIRAFSIIEVLLAVMILGIGLIMVATLFPVAASWTRESSTETVAQSVARSAMATLRQHYGPGGDQADALSSFSSSTVAALPGITAIPLAERAYRFGAPITDPATCTFFWTVLGRRSPAQPAEGHSVNIYVLVFCKSSLEQQFSEAAKMGSTGDPLYVPRAAMVDVATLPRPGEYGIGQTTGSVFRVVLGGGLTSIANPPLSPTDAAIWVAPPADGTAASPLVSIYQTTLSF